MNIAAAPQLEGPRANKRRDKTILDWLEDPSFKRRIAGLTPKHITPERLLVTFSQAVRRSAQVEVTRDDGSKVMMTQLMRVPQDRILGAFLICARLGLEPNSVPPQVHLIPFDVNRWDARARQYVYDFTDVQVIVDYQGYVELAYRSGKVEYVQASVVYENDDWEFEYGTGHKLRHRPMVDVSSGRPDRGAKIAAYAYAKIVHGGTPFEWMWWPDIMAIRDNSQGFKRAKRFYDEAVQKANGGPVRLPKAWLTTPWVAFEDAMARKTPFRQLQKWLPKTAELQLAQQVDERKMDFDKVWDSTDREVMDLDAEAYSRDDEGEEFDQDGVVNDNARGEQQQQRPAIEHKPEENIAKVEQEREPERQAAGQQQAASQEDGEGAPAMRGPRQRRQAPPPADEGQDDENLFRRQRR